MAVLRVTEAFAAFTNGFPESYVPGRLVDSDDPVVKGRESYFEPAEVAAARAAGVETASAAPGAKRTRTRARKAATKKAAAPAKKAAEKPAEKPAAAPPAKSDEGKPDEGKSEA